MSKKGFFQRWSDKKRAEKASQASEHVEDEPPQGESADQAEADLTSHQLFASSLTTATSVEASNQSPSQLSPLEPETQDLDADTDEIGAPDTPDETLDDAEEVLPTMADVEHITEQSTIEKFLLEGVSHEIKIAAFNKLFQLPMFNVRDDLNDYDDDYTKLKDLTEEARNELRYWGEHQKASYLDPSQDEVVATDVSQSETSIVDDANLQKAESDSLEDESANQEASRLQHEPTPDVDNETINEVVQEISTTQPFTHSEQEEQNTLDVDKLSQVDGQNVLSQHSDPKVKGS